MAYRTIHASGDPVIVEGLASGALTPGMLVELTNAAADTYVAHNTASERCLKCIVHENQLEGQGVTDAYASGDRVFCGIYRSGETAVVLIANGQNATKGSRLESDGAGRFNTGATTGCICIAQEAVDMSDSSGADPSSSLCLVRFI
jgi:hypothetical protein